MAEMPVPAEETTIAATPQGEVVATPTRTDMAGPEQAPRSRPVRPDTGNEGYRRRVPKEEDEAPVEARQESPVAKWANALRGRATAVVGIAALVVLLVYIVVAQGALTPEVVMVEVTRLATVETAMEEPVGAEPAESLEAKEPDDSGEELADLGGREVSIAVENAYLPFNYYDPETDEPAGWDYEVWNEICRLLNCAPVYVETIWDSLIQRVAEGELFDVAADGITITEERAQIVDFSIGYIEIEQRLLVRADEERIDSIEDIVTDEQLVLGAAIGTTNFETALQYLPDNRIISYEQFAYAEQALISGDIDATVADEIAGLGYMGESAEELKFVGPSLSSDELGFAFPKGSELVEPVNEALRRMKENGFLDEVNSEFFGPEFTITYADLES
jgi:polar amino acid transport system substrate-binding protein